jgi:hypothetical protein
MSDGIDERDRLTFWRNWYEAIRFKPEQERLEKYDALLAYVFDGIEPEKPTAEHPETANAYEIVNFVRATVAKSRAQRANGSKTKAKRKPTRSQAEANAKPKKAKAEQEQEQVQEQEQEQEQYANSISATTARERGKQPPTIEQFKAMAVKAGVPEDFAVYLHAELESVGWTTANGSCVENPIRYLKSAWNAEQKKIRAARVSGDDAFGGIGIAR